MAESSKNKNIVYFLVTSVIAGLLIYWAATTTNEQSPAEDGEEHDHQPYVNLAPEEAATHGVRIISVEHTPISIEVNAPGKIVLNPDAIAHIVPTAPGIARNIYKNIGEQVAKDDLMAIIESREMAESKASFLAALKREVLASNNFSREKALYDKKITSGQDYFDAETKAAEALIDLQLAKQRLEALGLTSEDVWSLQDASSPDLRLYEVRSPINGLVTKRHLTMGEVVSDNQEIFTVADLGNVWVELSLFAKDVDAIKIGQKVKLVSPSGKIAETEILFVNPMIDEETRTAKAIAALDNTQGFWAPGSFVNSKIIVENIAVSLSVPKEAVQEIDGEPIVFIPTTDGFEIRPIKLGRSDPSRYEIVEGLQSHEQIATGNTFLLKAEHEKHEAEHMD